jgi:predicted DNA-binding protein YlxM (UPF0122 family)/DNA-binding transcriptional MerR regulator
LTRQEKEKLVLDLYYNEGKTYSEIAKEARISLRDIGPILKKSGTEQSLSNSSQAYLLFSEGKTPIQVAIKLGLKEPEVHELYRHYWKLQQLYSLYQVHEHVKENIWYFVELYRLVKAAGMDLKHVKRLLEIANNDLPSVQAKYEGLRREVGLLESKKESLEKEIFGLHATLVQYRTSYQEESALIDTMHQERLELKESVREFENDNEEYINDKERGSNEVENAH